MADRDMELELDALKREVKSLTKQLKETASVGSDRFVDQARQSWDEARGQLEETWGSTKEKARDYSKQADRYARENPWQAAGIAAAAGLLLGLLSSRRRD